MQKDPFHNIVLVTFSVMECTFKFIVKVLILCQDSSLKYFSYAQRETPEGKFQLISIGI